MVTAKKRSGPPAEIGDVDLRQVAGLHGPEPRVLQCSGYRAPRYCLDQRVARLQLSDASAQLAIHLQRHETGCLLRERRAITRIERWHISTIQLSLQRLTRDLQQADSVGVSQPGCIPCLGT